MKMTREEAIRNFREHWASLAISGSEDKEDYLRRNGFPEIKNDCFLCEFVQDTQSDRTCLKKCPIEWPATSEQGVQPCKRSYYDDWRDADTPEERKRLAAIIRDLPEKSIELGLNEPRPEFAIGDWVKVLSIGDFHTTYEHFFKENNLMEFKDGFKRCENPDVGDVLQVKGNSINPHEYYGFIYVLQSRNGQIYLANNQYKSLELAEEPELEPKFKVGDIVTGNAESNKKYSFTNSEMTKAEVIGIPQDGIIAVKILEHKEKYWNDCIFSALEEKHFELVTDGPKPQKECPKEIDGEWVGDKPEFKVGDRVKVNGNIGIVKGITDSHPLVGIEFDNPVVGGHDFNSCLPAGKKGHCYFHFYEEIELLPSINHCPEPKAYTESKKFVFKGNKTVCTIEIDGRKWTGVAKCDPNDQWNEEIGRQWAELRANRKMLDAVEKELRRQ